MAPFGKAWRFVCLGVVCCMIFYLWVRANVFPVMDSQPVGIRLKIMRGGAYISRLAMWTLLAQAVFLWIVYANWGGVFIPLWLCIGNGIYSLCALLFLFFNGGLRIFCTSRRLSLFPRLLILATVWIPLVNLVVLGYSCRLVQEEYQIACEREALHSTRVESQLCRTRYPLVLVHGVLFRDLKYFNYWGRIPRELIRNGATVYYGGQEAVGTVENNAQELRETIQQVIAQTWLRKGEHHSPFQGRAGCALYDIQTGHGGAGCLAHHHQHTASWLPVCGQGLPLAGRILPFCLAGGRLGVS